MRLIITVLLASLWSEGFSQFAILDFVNLDGNRDSYQNRNLISKGFNEGYLHKAKNFPGDYYWLYLYGTFEGYEGTSLSLYYYQERLVSATVQMPFIYDPNTNIYQNLHFFEGVKYILRSLESIQHVKSDPKMNGNSIRQVDFDELHSVLTDSIHDYWNNYIIEKPIGYNVNDDWPSPEHSKMEGKLGQDVLKKCRGYFYSFSKSYIVDEGVQRKDLAVWLSIQSNYTYPLLEPKDGPEIIEMKLNIFLNGINREFYNRLNSINIVSPEWMELEEDRTIKLSSENGVFTLPVTLNNALTLDFVLDLGATDIIISPEVFLVLYKAKTITDNDFVGSKSYTLADGTILKSNVINLRSIKFGKYELRNVRAAISTNPLSPLLLGQSALQQFNSYRVDNRRMELIIEQ